VSVRSCALFYRKNGLLDSLLPSKLDLPLALVDAEGRVIDSLNGYFAPDMSAFAYFRLHSANTDDVIQVATPVVEPRTKKWQIQISRRLNRQNGDFAGVIVVMIDPAYFVEDYDRLNVDAGGAVMLISRENGMSAARIDDQMIISDTIDFSVAQGIQGVQPAEELLLKRPFDAIERIYSYAEMPRFMLMAVVGNPATSALARFERRHDMYYGSVTVASLLVLLFIGLLIQQASRLRRTTRMVTEAQLMLRAAADASLDAVFLFKACRLRGHNHEILDFTVADLNERGAILLGSTSEQVKDRRLIEVMPLAHSNGFVDKFKHVLATGEPLEEEIKVDFLPNRDVHWLQQQVVPIIDGVAVTARDITPRKEAELAMRKNQAELAAVNDASPLGLLRADASGHCTYVNRTFEFITGLTREEALGDAWMRAVHPHDREVLKTALGRMAKTRVPHQDTLRCVHPDGEIIWVSFKIAAMMVDGKVYGYVGTVDDITHLRKSVIALRESESRLRTIADTLPAMVAYIDAGQVYRFHNVAYEREFNQTGMTVLGKTILETMGAERHAFLEPYILRALAGETLTFEEDDNSAAVERTFEVVYIPQVDEDGVTVTGFHVMRQDITAQKREKQRLLRLSQIDALTGLTNRAGFLQKLHDAMAACRENAGLMAVMYMDIDRFKPVNDTYMRLLHTSDWHLGQTLHNFDRTYEHQRFLDWLLDTIVAEQVDALLIAGDIFDNSNPSAASQRQLYRFLQQARAKARRSSTSSSSPATTIRRAAGSARPAARSPRHRVVGHVVRNADGEIDLERMVVPLTGRDGEVKAWCVAVPFLRPGRRAARAGSEADETADRRLPVRHRPALPAGLRAGALALRERPGDPGDGPLPHGGRRFLADSERRILIGGTEALPAVDVRSGHRLRRAGPPAPGAKVGKQEHLRYCGSPLPLSFAEIGYQHQVLRIDLDGAQGARSSCRCTCRARSSCCACRPSRRRSRR
jgi:PAS domain S-box-containing protein